LSYPAQDRAGRIARGSGGQIIDLQRPRCGQRVDVLLPFYF
jgi:hypothetical protein